MLGVRGLGLRWPCRFHVVCLFFGRVGNPTGTRFLVEYIRLLWGSLSEKVTKDLEKLQFFWAATVGSGK